MKQTDHFEMQGRQFTLRILAVARAVTMFLLAATCYSAAAQSGGAPIKIGAILSTTGGIAPFGTDARPAIELFVEQINAKGGINGRRLELIVLNDESRPELALAAAKRLTQQEKVAAVIGPLSSPVTAIAGVIFEESKTPSLNCGCFSGPMTPYQFSTFPNKGMMRMQAEVAKARGLNKIGIIAQAGAVAETLKRTNVPDLEAEGISVAAFEQFQPSDTDFTPILARLRSQGIQHVYVATASTQAALVAKNFKQMNYPGTYWTFAGNANQAFVNLLGDSADVVNLAATRILVYSKLPNSDSAKARLVEFANAYKRKAGKEPGTYAAFFYDSMISLADAIAKAGGDDREKIREALENQKGLQLLNGTLNRSKSDHNGVDPEWVKLAVDPASKEFVIAK